MKVLLVIYWHVKISNNIVAVFVVQFDVHKGNIIEWQYPAGTRT